MTHYSRLSIIVMDVPAEHTDAEVAFWQAATGTTLTQYTRHPEYHGGSLAEHLGLLVQRLDTGPARVHVDIHTDDLDAEIARLEALGAQRAGQEDFWCVLRDPAGLMFCVVPEPADSFDRAGAQRWD